jgi:hypothetical protein
MDLHTGLQGQTGTSNQNLQRCIIVVGTQQDNGQEVYKEEWNKETADTLS